MCNEWMHSTDRYTYTHSHTLTRVSEHGGHALSGVEVKYADVLVWTGGGDVETWGIDLDLEEWRGRMITILIPTLATPTTPQMTPGAGTRPWWGCRLRPENLGRSSSASRWRYWRSCKRGNYHWSPVWRHCEPSVDPQGSREWVRLTRRPAISWSCSRHLLHFHQQGAASHKLPSQGEPAHGMTRCGVHVLLGNLRTGDARYGNFELILMDWSFLASHGQCWYQKLTHFTFSYLI